MKKPPFELTNQMVSDAAEIAELVGRLTSTDRLSGNPSLRWEQIERFLELYEAIQNVRCTSVLRRLRSDS